MRKKTKMLPNFKIVMVAAIFSLGTIQESMAYCSSSAYLQALTDFQACPQLDPEDLGSLVNLAETCRTLECTLECLVNAIGDCTNHEYFEVVDMAMFKTMFRYACSAQDDTVKALEGCATPVFENRCISNKNTAIQQAFLYFSIYKDVQDFIRDFCRVITDYRACAPHPPGPINQTATCSAEAATIVNNILEIDSSVSGCGIAQTNPQFAVHGGPTRCGEESTAKPATTTTAAARTTKSASTGAVYTKEVTVSAASAISTSVAATTSTPRATTNKLTRGNSGCLLNGKVLPIVIGLLLSVLIY